MTLWQDRFDAHSLWAGVMTLREALDELEVDQGDTGEQDALAYIGGVVMLLEKRREETDSFEVTPAKMDALHQQVANLTSTMQQAQAGSTTLAGCVPAADAVIDGLTTWPVMRLGAHLQGIAGARDSFLTKTKEALGEVSSATDTLQEKLNELDSAQEHLTAEVATERQRITEAVAESTTEAAEGRKAMLDENERQLTAARQDWIDRAALDEERAGEQLRKLEGHEKAARETVSATTAFAVATDYGEYARNKSRSAWVCDVGAAVIGSVGVAAIVIHLFQIDVNADTNVGLSLTRLAAALGTLGVATLLGKRGAQHHREARAAKRTDLAIRRIGPFIAPLQAEDREGILLEFTDRVFIRGDLDPGREQPEQAATSLQARLRRRRTVTPKVADGEAG